MMVTGAQYEECKDKLIHANCVKMKDTSTQTEISLQRVYHIIHAALDTRSYMYNRSQA